MSRSRKRKSTPRKPVEPTTPQKYRLSEKFISTVTISLTVLLFVLLGISLAVLLLSEAAGSRTGEIWAVYLIVAAFGLPLFAAAIGGGLALSRWGWIAGIFFGLGWIILVFVIANQEFRLLYNGLMIGPFEYRKEFWQFTGVAGMVIGGALYFVFGFMHQSSSSFSEEGAKMQATEAVQKRDDLP